MGDTSAIAWAALAEIAPYLHITLMRALLLILFRASLRLFVFRAVDQAGTA